MQNMLVRVEVAVIAVYLQVLFQDCQEIKTVFYKFEGVVAASGRGNGIQLFVRTSGSNMATRQGDKSANGHLGVGAIQLDH
jgi:hypothetical protein